MYECYEIYENIISIDKWYYIVFKPNPNLIRQEGVTILSNFKIVANLVLGTGMLKQIKTEPCL